MSELANLKALRSAWQRFRNGNVKKKLPLEDEFADMLETLFLGPLVSLPKPVALTEGAWTMQDLRIAIGRLQLKK